MPLHRRVARLSPENYFGRQAYFVTICCDHRAPFLRTPATAQSVLALLLQCAATHSFLLHAYCLMPDHSHVLAEALHDRSDLREFIRVFKQRSAFAFRKSYRRRLWEMSYYDHILRPSDRIEDVARISFLRSPKHRLDQTFLRSPILVRSVENSQLRVVAGLQTRAFLFSFSSLALPRSRTGLKTGHYNPFPR